VYAYIDEIGARDMAFGIGAPERNPVEIKAGQSNPVVIIMEKIDYPVEPEFIPVTGITLANNTVTAGESLTLTATVEPNDATNKDIVWSVSSAGNTGATLSNNVLQTTAAGTVVVLATIIDGKDIDENYTREFTIIVNEVVIPSYNVTFVHNDGTGPVVRPYDHGAQITENLAPRDFEPVAGLYSGEQLPAQYVFDGWYKEAGLQNRWGDNEVVTSSMILYAKWTAAGLTSVAANNINAAFTHINANQGNKYILLLDTNVTAQQQVALELPNNTQLTIANINSVSAIAIHGNSVIYLRHNNASLILEDRINLNIPVGLFNGAGFTMSGGTASLVSIVGESNVFLSGSANIDTLTMISHPSLPFFTTVDSGSVTITGSWSGHVSELNLYSLFLQGQGSIQAAIGMWEDSGIVKSGANYTLTQNNLSGFTLGNFGYLVLSGFSIPNTIPSIDIIEKITNFEIKLEDNSGALKRVE
jgi:uncharacterized repeat protein (TIGR02543 family)